MKATLVIPAHNESTVIGQTVKALQEVFDRSLTTRSIDWEIIVVDNASDDGTASVVERVAHPRVHTLRLQEKGKGRAVRAGFRDRASDMFGFTDADLSVSPEAIADAFLLVSSGEKSLVIGSRMHPDSLLPEREWWRTGSSQVFNFFSRWIIRVPFLDTQCPLKVMDRAHRDLFLLTEEDTWFFDAEFLALLHHLNHPVHEIPVLWTEHRYPGRKSKLSTTRDGLRSLAAFWRIRRRTSEKVAQLKKTVHNGSTMQWIIVGLGNPGGAYAHTRHNAGRIVLEAFGAAHGFSDFAYQKTHDALIARGTVGVDDVTLVAPETFMNASGKSLVHLVKYPEQAERLVVVHDDVDLPVGSWRFAFARGSGGQKGVESIMETIKTKDFVRVRIGVGKDGPKEKAGDIVLEKFQPNELAIIESIGKSEKFSNALQSLFVNGLEYSRSQWQKWKVAQEEVPPPQDLKA